MAPMPLYTTCRMTRSTGITPIILIGETGLIVTMNPKSPIRSVKDLIAYAKANPDKLNFGSAGVGGLGHLSQELFQLMTGVRGSSTCLTKAADPS